MRTVTFDMPSDTFPCPYPVSPLNEDRYIRGGDVANKCLHRQYRRAVANQGIEASLLLELAA